MAQTDSSRGYALNAPVSGTVTALTARMGQSTGTAPLMAGIPDGSRMRVELSLPNTAIAFVRKGQRVRLALDAFPVAQFGTVDAVISDISATTVMATNGEGEQPTYLVTADLEADYIRAFGARQPLLPGMTLTARIVTEDRTLLEWLFEPLFAVKNRAA